MRTPLRIEPDYKIWFTSRITSDSVGCGWSVPAGMIAPQILTEINELTSNPADR